MLRDVLPKALTATSHPETDPWLLSACLNPQATPHFGWHMCTTCGKVQGILLIRRMKREPLHQDRTSDGAPKCVWASRVTGPTGETAPKCGGPQECQGPTIDGALTRGWAPQAKGPPNVAAPRVKGPPNVAVHKSGAAPQVIVTGPTGQCVPRWAAHKSDRAPQVTGPTTQRAPKCGGPQDWQGPTSDGPHRSKGPQMWWPTRVAGPHKWRALRMVGPGSDGAPQRWMSPMNDRASRTGRAPQVGWRPQGGGPHEWQGAGGHNYCQTCTRGGSQVTESPGMVREVPSDRTLSGPYAVYPQGPPSLLSER